MPILVGKVGVEGSRKVNIWQMIEIKSLGGGGKLSDLLVCHPGDRGMAHNDIV